MKTIFRTIESTSPPSWQKGGCQKQGGKGAHHTLQLSTGNVVPRSNPARRRGIHSFIHCAGWGRKWWHSRNQDSAATAAGLRGLDAKVNGRLIQVPQTDVRRIMTDRSHHSAQVIHNPNAARLPTGSTIFPDQPRWGPRGNHPGAGNAPHGL